MMEKVVFKLHIIITIYIIAISSTCCELQHMAFKKTRL